MNWVIEPASSFVISQWLFLKGLAFIYLFAFGSLLFQVKGLYGSQGITSIEKWLKEIKPFNGKYVYFKVPSVFWINASDRALQLVASLGIIFALFLFLNIGPAPFLFFLLWLFYLSFVTTGSVFLSFQWDALLLEVGFIAIFFSMQRPPLFLFIFLLWFVLFRFMVSSAIVKWKASTPEWRKLEAMNYHYETQPLPTRPAYYLHHLPKMYGKLSTLATLVIECIVPFFIFSPAPIRLIVFILLTLFQITILITGNYAFFNWLTLILGIPLLEDQYLHWLHIAFFIPAPIHSSFFMQVVLSLVAVLLMAFNLIQLINLIVPLPRIYPLLRILNSYYLVNSYGLFANMTTERPEIIIEGSNDGIHWQAYEFKWKPDDLKKAPLWVAPHQPRLDWQLWFAALSHYQYNPWFMNFLVRLLEGSEDVLALLKTNPFPQRPPRFIRALLYDYRFSDFKTKKATGQWWSRTFKRIYMPPISLGRQERKQEFKE